MARTSGGRAQDRRRVAGGQDYEVPVRIQEERQEQETGKASGQESR